MRFGNKDEIWKDSERRGNVEEGDQKGEEEREDVRE